MKNLGELGMAGEMDMSFVFDCRSVSIFPKRMGFDIHVGAMDVEGIDSWFSQKSTTLRFCIFRIPTPYQQTEEQRPVWKVASEEV